MAPPSAYIDDELGDTPLEKVSGPTGGAEGAMGGACMYRQRQPRGADGVDQNMTTR